MLSLEERCRAMLRQGASTNDLLALVRKEGRSRIESLKMLIDVTGVPLREAKFTVHSSDTWADLRKEAETFHDDIETAASELARKEPKTKK